MIAFISAMQRMLHSCYGLPLCMGYEFTVTTSGEHPCLHLHGSQLWQVIPINKPAANDRLSTVQCPD